MKSGFFSFFKTIYGIVFSIIVAILLFFDNILYCCKIEFFLPNGVFFCIVLMILLAGVGFYCLVKNKKTLLKKCSTLNIDKFILVATVLLFLGQCYVFYNTFFLSGWDAGAVRNFVETIMNDGDRGSINNYFSRYPNNLFIAYLYLFIQKINNSFGVFNGAYSYMCIVVLNCIINAFSCLLSYKTARTFVSPAFALIAYILCIFSVGISGWTIICYSDSLALFIPILSVYLYCKQYKTARMKMVGFISAGFASAIGYFIKPQCLFVLIGILIVEVLNLVGKKSLKSLLRPITLCLVAVIAFSVTNIGLGHLNNKYNVHIDKERTFGYSHFLMMGANQERNGVYFQEDVDFSASFATSEQRKEANIDVFKERVASMKSGFLTHLTKKMLSTFNDGTFAWSLEGNFFATVPENINNKMAPFLKSIYHIGNRFAYFATFQHLVWLFILLCSLLTVFSKKANYDQNNLSLLWIVLLGLVLYEMLFEVRARYVYIFVPLLCTLAPIGVRNIGALVCDFFPRIKNKFKG